MRYRTLIADPPWQYRNTGINGAAEKHYPTMSTQELRSLPVSSLADKDATLLLWATWPMLGEALELIRAWGFYYVTGFPWIKLQKAPQPTLFGDVELISSYGPGFWVRGCSEPILIARRGKVSPPLSDYAGLLSERIRHSRKPESLYEYAEELEGPYLELWAREQRPGWRALGNEIDGQDIREAIQQELDSPILGP